MLTVDTAFGLSLVCVFEVRQSNLYGSLLFLFIFRSILLFYSGDSSSTVVTGREPKELKMKNDGNTIVVLFQAHTVVSDLVF